MTLLEKLSGIQTELKAPKNQRNNFGNYNYRSCEDILEAVKPLLNAKKCVLTISDEVVQTGERYHVKATATLYDSEGTDKVIVSAFAREEETKKGMDGSQITGASSSYARKYALNGLFCIDDTKDSDGTNNHGKDTPAAPKITCPDCGKEIKSNVGKDGKRVSPEEILEKCGCCVVCYRKKNNG